MKFLKQLLVIILLVVIGGFFFSYHEGARNSLSSFRAHVTDVFSGEVSQEKLASLEAENAHLRDELGREEKGNYFEKYGTIEANLYSRYPFNDKGLVVINKGEEDGIREKMPVVTSGGGLFGIVRSVSRTQSEVQTIFDSEWRTSVRIGSVRDKAVLQGGTQPRLELIRKGTKVETGDGVFNISPDFPIDLYTGSLGGVEEVLHDVWATADIDVGFLLEDVSSVLVIIDFP